MRRMSRLHPLLALLIVAACDSPSGVRTPARLDVVSGDLQTDTVGGELAQPLVVRVVDDKDRPVKNQPVNFVITGGGSVSPGSATTDQNGEARGRWTLGPVAGAQTATAAGAGLPAVTFTATATPGRVARVVLAPEGIAFRFIGQTQALTVQAYDALGNLVGGPQATIVSQNAAVVALDPGSIARATGEGSARLVATVAGSAAADTAVVTVQRVPLAAQSIAVAGPYSCAVQPDGRAVCWGSNFSGGLGRTATGGCGAYGRTPCELAPAAVEGGITFASVSAGPGSSEAHTCGLTPSGQAYCWGTNRYGQLGDGTTTTRAAPVAVAGTLRFQKLSVGSYMTCGIATDDRAYCWGTGALGYSASDTCGGRPCELFPRPVAGGLKFTEIATTGVNDRDHTCALTSAGGAYCWGRNDYGQLGRSGGSLVAPAPVATTLSFRSITVGETFTCAVTLGGAAYCWGRNEMGQLGTLIGTTHAGPNPVPVPVDGGLTYDAVFAGTGHACGITSSRQAYCWGRASDGQLGNNNDGTFSYAAPQAVSGGLTWTALDLGGVHTCGIASSGKVYCWGSNVEGVLGTADTTSSKVPVLVYEGGL